MLVLVVMLVVFKGPVPTGAATWFLVALVWPGPASIPVLCAPGRPPCRGERGLASGWDEVGGRRLLRSIRFVAVCRGPLEPSSCPGRLNFQTVTPSCSDGSLAPGFWRTSRLSWGWSIFAVPITTASQAPGADAASPWIGVRQAGEEPSPIL